MSDPFGLTHGFVYLKDELYLAAVDLELEEDNVYHGYVMRWLKGEWGHWKVANRIIGLGVYDIAGVATAFATGPDGRVQVRSQLGIQWEAVDSDGDGPWQRRPLTCVRRVGDHIYVAGMKRMVYRRALTGGWQRCDDGIRVPPESEEVTGLLDIHGFDEGELYAVGFQGQIWQHDGNHWWEIDSPTNRKLRHICCAETGQVFIAGSGGMILRGRHNAWEVVEQDVTEEAFSGIEYAFGSLYLATEVGDIYRLDAQDELTLVDTGNGKPSTTHSLHYNDGVLLSTGAHDIYLFDGERWMEIEHP